MITAERLEELIKQGATIWSDGFNEEIKLDPKNCRVIGILSCNGFNQYLEVKEDEKQLQHTTEKTESTDKAD